MAVGAQVAVDRQRHVVLTLDLVPILHQRGRHVAGELGVSAGERIIPRTHFDLSLQRTLGQRLDKVYSGRLLQVRQRRGRDQAIASPHLLGQHDAESPGRWIVQDNGMVGRDAQTPAHPCAEGDHRTLIPSAGETAHVGQGCTPRCQVESQDLRDSLGRDNLYRSCLHPFSLPGHKLLERTGHHPMAVEGEDGRVSGEAGTTIPDPGVEEIRADPLVVAHPDGHLPHVGTQRLADVGDLVDEADAGGQEGVRGVLDHLRRAQVGDHNGRPQGQVELGHLLGRLAVQGAQHDAVGVHEVVDGRTLPQELGIGDDAEGDRLGLVLPDDVGHPVARAHGNGGLVDDDHRMVHHLGDGTGGHPHVAQIGLPIHALRRPHGDEDELRLPQRLLVGGGEGEPACFDVTPDHLLQPGLVDGHDPPFEPFDPFLVDVQTDDPIAQIGQARPGHQANVTDANYGDLLHRTIPP